MATAAAPSRCRPSVADSGRATRWPEEHAHYEELAKRGQSPRFLVIACSDSRVSLEWITQSGPGELFVCRNAGNMAPRSSRGDDVSATIEYAVSALGVRDIVVCGHSDCGAMMPENAGVGYCRGRIKHA